MFLVNRLLNEPKPRVHNVDLLFRGTHLRTWTPDSKVKLRLSLCMLDGLECFIVVF